MIHVACFYFHYRLLLNKILISPMLIDVFDKQSFQSLSITSIVHRVNRTNYNVFHQNNIEPQFSVGHELRYSGSRVNYNFHRAKCKKKCYPRRLCNTWPRVQLEKAAIVVPVFPHGRRVALYGIKFRHARRAACKSPPADARSRNSFLRTRKRPRQPTRLVHTITGAAAPASDGLKRHGKLYEKVSGIVDGTSRPRRGFQAARTRANSQEHVKERERERPMVALAFSRPGESANDTKAEETILSRFDRGH